MNVEVICTPLSNYEDIVKDLEDKFSTLDIDPNVLLVFFTDTVLSDHGKVLAYLRDRFPDTKMAGCFVEGYTTPNETWASGLAILLVDSDNVDVFYAKGKDAFKKIGRDVSGWDASILIFPLFYFPGRFEMLRFYFSNIYHYTKYISARSLNDKIRVLREYSDALESRYVYPANKVLRSMPEDTDIIGMNLVPLEARIGFPKIFVNYESIGRGIVAVCFKGKLNASFHDVFPERGDSFEETVEILRNTFPDAEIVRVVKRGVAIGEVDGMRATKFLEAKVKALREMSKDEVLSKLNDGQFQMVTPYALAFVSEKTYGCSLLGLAPYPLGIYPSLFDMDCFYDEALFLGEYYNLKRFEELFKCKRFEDSFDLFLIDHNVFPMFGGRVTEIAEYAREFCQRHLGLFTSCPSIRLKRMEKRYMSEIEEGLCFTGTGTSVILEMKL